MKRFFVLFALIAVLVVGLPSSLFAQSSKGLTSYYSPGNVVLGIDVGGGASLGYLSLAVYPGAEFLLAHYQIGDYLPIDIGAAVRARASFDAGYGGLGLGLGAGGFGTVHFGFKGIPGDIGAIIGRFDLFLGLGLAVDFLPGIGFGFSQYSGFNYFINDTFAVSLTDQYWGGYYNYWDYTIGAHFRFGSTQAAKKAM